MRQPAFHPVKWGLLAGLVVAATFFGTDTASAHGSCYGTSWRSASGTNVNYGGTTHCSQEADLLENANVLWSMGSGFPIFSMEEYCWDLDTRQNDSECAGTDGMGQGRCYFAFGLHHWWDHHSRIWPPPLIYAHQGISGSWADAPIYAACRF
ncbi:MAG: hypothetical protein WEE64_10960 [Dehalococcoidia bacterium]